MTKPDTFAFDRATARNTDADGRMHVAHSHISKAAVNPYYGREIPGWQALGLTPDRIYNLLRDPAELEKAAPTFARLPILREHMPVTVDAPQPDLIVGAIGSNVEFNPPYLDADLCFWDSSAIAGIETGQVKELSCGYRYVPVMEPGDYNGEPYDGRMTEIRGNHLALVEVGRAGADVVVADQNPFSTRKETAMKMTKLGKALFVALAAAYPTFAQDSAVPALVGNATRKGFKKDEVKAKLLALDADVDADQLDNLLDSLLDAGNDPDPTPSPAATVDTDPEPVAESRADKLRKLLAGKVDDDTMNAALGLIGADEDPDDDKKKDDDMKPAMDALETKIRTELREADEARRDVRNVVGDVIGMDSAADIYAFALDHMKVDRKGVEGAAALRAVFKAAGASKAEPGPAPIALDAKAAVTQFPGLSRFRNV